MNMKPLTDIQFGFSDAENYRRRENKELFNKIFLRTDALKKIEQPSTFFLVGEKGTGKTAYAVHLSNTQTPSMISAHKFIRETDYHKFISMKSREHLQLSDYVDIWKVILLLLISREVYERKTFHDLLQYPKFKVLNAAIDEYYSNAFSPEIISALKIVEDTETAAKIMAKHVVVDASVDAKAKTSVASEKASLQINLMYIRQRFEEALSSLKLHKGVTLFIDGIDIRPGDIEFKDYLGCIKGLANAAWSLNNDFFPSIKDSKGRIRIIMLVRPDIFNSLGLQNRNTKLRDNSAILSWITDYNKHRTSELFLMADRLFGSQQDRPVAIGTSWDHYFPFNASRLSSEQVGFSSFISVLRYSNHRPRDILTILDILNMEYQKGDDKSRVFRYEDLLTSDFKKQYGEYLLGELKDGLSFYYNEAEFELFLKFFEYLNGSRKFTYEEYIEFFNQYADFIVSSGQKKPSFMKSGDDFLQFLYDQNVICYIEETDDEPFIRWCFRERSLSNISPKVKIGHQYEIHYGLSNTLNTGKHIRSVTAKVLSRQDKRKSGSIKSIQRQKGFGFIEADELGVDLFFHRKDCVSWNDLVQGATVTFNLAKDEQSRICAKNVEMSQPTPKLASGSESQSEREARPRRGRRHRRDAR
jgi:cold shock CspA family protein